MSGQNDENARPPPRVWTRHDGPRVGRVGDWNNSSANTSQGGGQGRFATLGSLGGGGGPSSSHGPSGGHGGHGHGHGSDDDEDEDKAESWFTGGERSGLSVQNPESQSGSSLVRDLIKKATQGSRDRQAAAESSQGRQFTGGGYRLGGDEVEGEYIPDPDSAAAREEVAVRVITLWRDGFQIGDGELRGYEDPVQRPILATILNGTAPIDLLNVEPNQPVDVQIARRMNEDYVPPQGTRAFGGSGHRLGAPVPEASSAPSSAAMPGGFPAASASPPAASEPASITTRFEVDQNLPTTTVQIRLADGTRLPARMNLTHTVGDIRNFINASRPENRTRPYTIGTTFPNRTLENNEETIETAKLQNSVVVQRWV